jgi:hypothetical protein
MDFTTFCCLFCRPFEGISKLLCGYNYERKVHSQGLFHYPYPLKKGFICEILPGLTSLGNKKKRLLPKKLNSLRRIEGSVGCIMSYQL